MQNFCEKICYKNTGRNLLCAINCCRYKIIGFRGIFFQKYVREILCCFRIFRQIHFCKFRNFAKKFANCERTFSHFFRWKPYFKEKVDNRLFFLQIRLDTYYNGRKETWGRLRWKKGGWTPNGNFYSDLTLNWIGVGPSCPVHLKLKQAYNFCSHRHWRHSLTINTTSNPPPQSSLLKLLHLMILPMVLSYFQSASLRNHESFQAHVKHVSTPSRCHKHCFSLLGAFLKCLPAVIRAHLLRDDFSNSISLALKADKIYLSRVSLSSVFAVSNTFDE